ncbi:hypothetical protein Tco_0471180 [Tanacetum coccineum]
MTRKKRKNVDDLHDYFKLTKRYKTSVQYGDLLAGTVLNDPALGLILFNAQHGQDFISIEDFAKLNNDMLYHVQENFFRLHQEPGMDDLARTLSSLLVAEVDKRNLNPNKHMRLIEQLRHSALALQFNLVGNAKLNHVDFLLEDETKCFSFKRFTRREKDILYFKKNKAYLLGNDFFQSWYRSTTTFPKGLLLCTLVITLKLTSQDLESEEKTKKREKNEEIYMYEDFPPRASLVDTRGDHFRE